MRAVRKIRFIKKLLSRTIISETKYKLYKNKLTSILRFSEKSYYSKRLLENKGNAKRIWKILNTVINKKTRPNELPRLFINNGETISSNKAIASEFNVFSPTIGPKLADSMPILNNGVTIYDYMGHPNRNSMFITPVSEDEINTIVKSCKPKHSKDCDDMSMYVVSEAIWPIVKPLAHILNLSFTSGIFPDDMKIAKVIPLFKNGSKTDLTNYRPISIIS